MELKPCKMATAVSLIVMLLLLTIGTYLRGQIRTDLYIFALLDFFKPIEKRMGAMFRLNWMRATGGQGAATGDECSAISRSTTFQGDCHSRDLCVATCRSEGHTAGYCFRDVADPDHRVCLCTSPCPPGPAMTTTMSRGNMV